MMKLSTFRFSRKNRPTFKTAFCPNNEKFREEKKGLTSDLPRFTSMPEVKNQKNNHPNYRSFDEREEDRKGKSCFSMSLKVEKKFL